jgi:hypothetical protein
MGDREERSEKKIGCSMGPIESKILIIPRPRQTLILMGDREERNEKRWCGRNSDLRKAASKT